MDTTSMTTSRGAGGRRDGERKKAVTKSTMAGLQFLFGRIARYLKKGRYAQSMGIGAPIYLATILEYFASEPLDQAFDDVSSCGKTTTDQSTNTTEQRICSQ